MNDILSEIPERILELAKGALAQANTHAAFADPGNEHWSFISVLNAAHAGELFIKAIIAKEHPLLIFKDIFLFDDNKSDYLDLANLIRSGKTHDFEKLPKILWAVTDERIPDTDCFERIRKARNSIQHFCAPEGQNFRSLSMEFIYTVIDPLIFKHFGLYAIEYHEDHDVGYDYLVGVILRHQLFFSLPPDFRVGEIDIEREAKGVTGSYREWVDHVLLPANEANR